MILVTGASGFIGKGLCRHLHQAGRSVIAISRYRESKLDLVCTKNIFFDLTKANDLTASLSGCHTVIHLAARVHVMRDGANDPLAAYRSVNVDATLNLAMQAARNGVTRFIFVSSAKVNGESTSEIPFSPFDTPAPPDAYALSKWEAEQGLHRISKETGLEVVIVRPPLVYGPGVGANFLSLMRLVNAGWPLPLGNIRNRRSMIALENLVDLLVVCADHPEAAGQTFMASDDHDVSTSELVQMLAHAMGRRIILLPLPAYLLTGAAKLIGQSAAAGRLLGSLQIDISHTMQKLGWRPPVDMHQALQQTASHFLTYH